MSAQVPHRRPALGDATGIQSRLPVSADDNGKLAGLANFCSGHGGMLIPWCGINELLDDETATYHFYVAPKKRAVERVWRIMMYGGIGSATVTAGGASAETVAVDATSQVYSFREPLTAATSTAGDTTLVIDSPEGGTLTVEAISMYEQTRGVLELGTPDFGVELTSLRPGERVIDTEGRTLRGVADGYKEVDARRAGLFHWSTGIALNQLEVTQAGYTDITAFYPPALGAVVNAGTTSTTFTCAVYAKVNAGSGNVRFSSTQNGSNVVLACPDTSFTWVTGSLTINAEDLTAADGRRSSGWETIQIEAQKDTATTLTIAAISVVRVTAPI